MPVSYRFYDDGYSIIMTDGTATLINGDEHDNIILGGDLGEELIGAQGNDALHGGDEADILLGGAGYDTLYGDDGADTHIGGNGGDMLYGGDAGDQLWGGDGSGHEGDGEIDIFAVRGGEVIKDADNQDYVFMYAHHPITGGIKWAPFEDNVDPCLLVQATNMENLSL